MPVSRDADAKARPESLGETHARANTLHVSPLTAAHPPPVWGGRGRILVRFLRQFAFVLGILLYYLRLHRVVMHLSRRRPKVLLYHSVAPNEPLFLRELESNTRPEVFERHLAFVVRHYHVVDVSRLDHGPVPEHALAVTFDDGYRSVLTHAAPLLRRQRVPATVYLVTSVLDSESLIWVEELNWFLRTHPGAAHLVAASVGCSENSSVLELLDCVRQRGTPQIIRALLQQLRLQHGCEPAQLATSEPLYLSWEDALQLRSYGLGIGNHTRSHVSLPVQDPATQLAEIREARERLSARFGPVKSFAFPFGDHDAASKLLARKAGHDTVMLVGGVNRPVPDPCRLARIPVSAHDDASLFAQIEVVPAAVAAAARLLALLGLPNR
jgi:peptidoglycan/xylan/chitin deacetylase (PgdA/CDA1 family)